MIAALVIIGQCVIVMPAAMAHHAAPQWQGHVIYRTDDGYGVAPVDRPSIAVTVPADRVASCGPRSVSAEKYGSAIPTSDLALSINATE